MGGSSINNRMRVLPGIVCGPVCKDRALKKEENMAEVLRYMVGRECTDPFGFVFATKTAMCLFYGVSLPVYCNRIRSGKTQLEALKPVSGNGKRKRHGSHECADHLGRIYKSMKEMCGQYGVEVDTYKIRIIRGYSQEDALTMPSVRGKTCTDHLGRIYGSVKEMCGRYSISYQLYTCRIKAGWSKKEALITLPGGKRQKPFKIADHFGNLYETEASMCAHYGINPATFESRMKKGQDIGTALTSPLKDTTCTDHLGNVYKSGKKMCAHYGITYDVYKDRIDLGWTQEKALTEPVRQTPQCMDHLGNVYKTIKEMCGHYGISYQLYTYRIKAGWTQERALTGSGKGHTRGKACVDYRGKRYDSNTAMCGAFKIDPDAYTRRIRYGWDQKRALITPTRKKVYAGFSVSAFSFERQDSLFYECACKNCGYADILTYEEMEEHERRHSA